MIVAAVSGPVLGASPIGRTQVMTPVLCGVDLMEVARFEREAARRGDGLTEELFSPSELAWCRRRRRAAEGYAMAYAAKEALFKALGTGKVGRMAWSDVEVAWPEGASQPTMALAGETAEVARQLEVTGVYLRGHHHSRVCCRLGCGDGGSPRRSVVSSQ